MSQILRYETGSVVPYILMTDRPLRGCMDVFMGIEGTRIPTLLGSGELVYFNIVMRHGKSAPRRDNVAAIAPPAGGQVHRKLPPPALY